jgi:hypothetical protein
MWPATVVEAACGVDGDPAGFAVVVSLFSMGR